MNNGISIEQLLRWRAAKAEAEAPPAPNAARLLGLVRSRWETWPERLRSLIERLHSMQVAYGHAMTERKQSSGSHFVPALLVKGAEEIETSASVLYLNVRDGRLRLRLEIPLEEMPELLSITLVCVQSKIPLFSSIAARASEHEFRLEADLPDELARKFATLRVTDQMPFQLILQSTMNDA